ncbi:MAG: serine hydrolase, partial [Arcicella sp.]|nr:serine hydrolase [Arcicella sp.]
KLRIADGLGCRACARALAGKPRRAGDSEYANLNYGIIATVMEAATDERFDRLMTRLVLRPLRLDAGYNWQGPATPPSAAPPCSIAGRMKPPGNGASPAGAGQ